VQLVVELCPGTGRSALVLGGSRTATAARDRLLAGGWAVTSASGLPAPSPHGAFLAGFDVLVACTGSGETVVGADALADAAARRGDTPLVVLDLSVPRDVAPRAGHARGVLLYDVDALAAAGAPVVAARRAGIADAERIVDDELARFEAWRADRMLAPTIKALRGHVREVVADTVDAGSVERVVTRLLHAPTRRLREAAAEGRGEHYALLVRSLFGVDDDVAGPAAPAGVRASS
jgi:glutamyl-tRNA reductase